MVYLVNNPDSASEISSKLKPEQFQNSLIRRYYEYILNRIIDGLDPLNNITADFSSDEASKLFQLMSQTIPSASTPQAMREYIEVINEESQKLSSDDISSMSPDQLRDYLERMKKNKQ